MTRVGETQSVGDKGNFIAGREAPGGSRRLSVICPATGAELGTLARSGCEEIDEAVQAAQRAFETPGWRRMAHADRGRVLLRLATVIREHEEELAVLESLDVGKPISQARNDVRTSARYFEYYGTLADKAFGSVIPVRWGAIDFTMREPYGVVAQIIPWNFPLMMGSRGIAPALAAGNCVVAKPAEDASLTILRLAELAIEAGFPAGALNVVTGYGAEAGDALVRHPLVRHITFTGSVATGTAVMQAAAEGVRPVALELGGKSPNLVFPDADLDAAATSIARSILVNAGQTCNACTRLLVHDHVHDALMERLRAHLAAVRLGHPLADADLGPVISDRQRQRIRGHLDAAAEDGVVATAYGRMPDEPELAGGFYMRPVLLENVAPEHRAFHEEIFGPALAITRFGNDEQAAQLANATNYGLVAGVWTQNVSRAMLLSQTLQAGQVYINGWGTGGSVEVPFGGYKQSGFGREKGVEGLLSYTQLKSITAFFA